MRTKITEPGHGALAREARQRESESTFQRLAEALGSAIFICDGERIRYVNHAAETITEYTREELLTTNFGNLVYPGSRQPVSRRPIHLPDAEFAPHGELKILTKNGAERCLDVTEATIEFDGVLTTLISAFDLTKRKQVEAQAQLLAVTDPLTGLGNYRRFLDVLHAEIERSGRTGRPFAVLLLDLDGLKKINDRYGHLIGSQALCRLADVLRVFCRCIDTAARYGGDEFAVILPETTAVAAGLVASRIRRRLATDSLEPPLSASIGVAVCPQDGETIEALLRAADRELYRMKCGEREASTPSVCSLTSSARSADLSGTKRKTKAKLYVGNLSFEVTRRPRIERQNKTTPPRGSAVIGAGAK
jgi:diguanylate cyclase (GGDEF)-like protein/PAS domain S-box-containing protein